LTHPSLDQNAVLFKQAELNAFTTPDLVTFIERKLIEAGADHKVVPPREVILDRARIEGRVALERLVQEEVAQLVSLDEVVGEFEATIFSGSALQPFDTKAVTAALAQNRVQALKQNLPVKGDPGGDASWQLSAADSGRCARDYQRL
jgi:hypothetical protein